MVKLKRESLLFIYIILCYTIYERLSLLKKINITLIMGMIIGTLYFVIFKFNSNKIISYLLVVPILCFPSILNKTKYKMGDKERLFYYIFIFLADYLGCIVNLYNTTNWYDTLVHFCSGFFSFLVGLFILDRSGIEVSNIFYRIFFCICVVMFIASIWELFEFEVDSLLGMNLQHSIDTGVRDTMFDILVAFIGGLIFSVSYYVYKRSIDKS